jgi:hypothetical protein
MRKPSGKAIVLGLIPFCGMCFSVSFWDRVTPMVFGLPFNLFWLIAWIGISSVCIAFANLIEERRNRD